MACTTILVGKAASYDGSTIVARNEDSPNGVFEPKRFVSVDPAGRTSYTSVLGHLTVALPEAEGVRYTAMPNADLREGLWEEAGFNARNVAMSATETITSNERVLAADPLVTYRPAKGAPGEQGHEPERPGGIGEEDMVTLVLPYATSARDGVLRMGALLAEHGTYEMNGVAFQDADEIWWLETVGGHHWIARRVPDDAYVTMPNQLGIDSFDLDDAEGEGREHLCSPDLRAWMADNHLDLTLGGDGSRFDPRAAFGSHTNSDHVYNTPRAWIMQRFLNPYDEVWDGPDADHKPMSDDIPWARQPERKITIEDVKYVLSSHYQGTPYDPYGKLGDEHTRHMFRPIGINRQSQLAVMQIRPYRPQASRALQWIAYGSNPFNTLMPFYANINATPKYLEDTTTRVTTENFYWENRIIAALCDAAFADTSNAVDRYQEKTGGWGHRHVAQTDAAIADLLAFEPFEAEADDDDLDDVQPMEPDDIIAAVRNDEVRAALTDANQKLADFLKEETDKLLDSVLYTTSMKMKNGFHMSDF